MKLEGVLEFEQAQSLLATSVGDLIHRKRLVLLICVLLLDWKLGGLNEIHILSFEI